MDATWLQYWAYLPAIAEEQMNDGTGPPGQPSISESTTHHHLARADTQFEVNSLSSANALAYPSRGYQARHPSQALPANPSGQASSYAVVSSVRQSTAAYAVSEHQRRGLTLFPMAAMTETIPEYRTQSIAPFAQQQRVPSGMSTPSFFYQIQQLPQFAGQTGFNHSGHPGWIPMQYPSPYPAPYPQNDPLSPADPSAQGFSPHMQPPSAPFAGVGLAQYPLAGHAWHILQHQQMYPYYSQMGGYGSMRRGRSSGRHPSPSSRSSNLPSTESLARQQHVGLGAGAPGQVLGGLEPESAGRAGAPPIVSGNPVASTGNSGAAVAHASAPRGPPRKPKQSGHALWVGNLPPATNIIELKDYFSREATNDIESVFLISKSNCAFVNYKTEEACATAMTRFHNSGFKGVRLVCRLRRTAKTSDGDDEPGPAPKGPSSVDSSGNSDAAAREETPPAKASVSGEDDQAARESVAGRSDRYFVLKSLTTEDLESSVRHGVWSTQRHNESRLNEAYSAGAAVYLIFSANKSGEYYGYARMASIIDDDAAIVVPRTSRAPRPEETLHPRAIPTPATESAPRGQIIDDSARGTIFWEADTRDDDDNAGEPPSAAVVVGGPPEQREQPRPQAADRQNPRSPVASSTPAGPSTVQSFPSEGTATGRPFRVEWLMTTRLPFYRTRGLRNPWNANREVKIARDGTELETSVGGRLLEMFQQHAQAHAQSRQHGYQQQGQQVYHGQQHQHQHQLQYQQHHHPPPSFPQPHHQPHHPHQHPLHHHHQHQHHHRQRQGQVGGGAGAGPPTVMPGAVTTGLFATGPAAGHHQAYLAHQQSLAFAPPFGPAMSRTTAPVPVPASASLPGAGPGAGPGHGPGLGVPTTTATTTTTLYAGMPLATTQP
ncbi:MAG: hypothetical protein M1815_002575 [Lichina confinis]|nr:MAG: hypothetical protein M1815_002575 [Lichina confinis]